MGARIREVLDAYAAGGSHADAHNDSWAQRVNKTYKRMSEGHHFDGLAIVQTSAFDDPGYILRAAYNESLAPEALHHGKLTTAALGFAAALAMADRISDSNDVIAAINSVFRNDVAEASASVK